MKRTLVTYFSASGVTARIAGQLANAIGADLYEIKPETPYTKADLNWMDKNARSTVEMKNKSFRPPLADRNVNISDYDTVFIGFPIWWYVAPTIINTFLEAHDFSGKRIVLFATSGGSSFGNTVQELRVSLPADAELVEGKVLNGRFTDVELTAWCAGME